MRYRSAITDAARDGSDNGGLVVVAELGASLADARDLEGLAATLQRRLKWLVPATYVSLCILDADGSRYSVVTAHGSGQTYSIDEGLVGWTLRHGMALDIPDLQDEVRLPPGLGGTAFGRGTGSLLVFPLAAGDEVIGAFTIGSHAPNAYEQTDRGVLNLVVMQVAAGVRAALAMAELDGAEAIVAGMARAVEAKDAYTAGHGDRVTRYALMLARAAGLPQSVHDLVAHAGPLHDVGKIGVPDAVLTKADRLTDEEFELIMRHPTIGDEIVSPLRSLRRLRGGIRHHHERYDGRGYPDRLSGEAIPLVARVLALADAFDAMTSTRSYRPAMPVTRALAIIAANEGPQWDPRLAPIFHALPLESAPAARIA